uniref:Uncharacterized protein n=1 Tax=Arundo donax TaxID=35708 RepID=A0A0A9H643_ARUDO
MQCAFPFKTRQSDSRLCSAVRQLLWVRHTTKQQLENSATFTRRGPSFWSFHVS